MNWGVLLGGSAHRGPFSLATDFVYLSMTSKNDGRLVSVDDMTPGMPGRIPVDVGVNVNTRTDLDGILWTLSAGYALRQSGRSSTDVFLGVRYLGVDVASRWNLTTDITGPGNGIILSRQGRISSDTDLWDAIVGVRGQFALGQGRWSIPYSVDVGTGSTELSWNAIAGLAYEFAWGDLLIAYRHLEYDQDTQDLLQNFSFGGPAFGVRLKF